MQRCPPKRYAPEEPPTALSAASYYRITARGREVLRAEVLRMARLLAVATEKKLVSAFAILAAECGAARRP